MLWNHLIFRKLSLQQYRQATDSQALTVDSTSYYFHSCYKPNMSRLSIDFFSIHEKNTSSESQFRHDYNAGKNVSSFIFHDRTAKQNFDQTRFYPSSTEAVNTIIEYEPQRVIEKYASDWIMLAGILNLVFLIVIKQFTGNYIQKIGQAVFNSNASTELYRDYIKNPTKIPFLLHAVSVINISLFAYQSTEYYTKSADLGPYFSVFGVAAIFIFFRLIYRLANLTSGYIFDMQSISSENHFNIRMTNIIISFFTFPLIFGIAYSNYPEILISLGIGIFFLAHLFRYIRLYKIIFKNRIRFLYLFLYLCTLEIIPIIIIVKTILE